MEIMMLILSIIGVFIAIYIPKKIEWNQMYSNLISEYRSYDFAIAVQGIIEFFVIDCKSDTSKIKEKYKKRFLKEIYGFENAVSTISEIRNKSNMQLLENDSDKTLHFQRRLLTQFYADLNDCLKTSFVGPKKILKDFTKSEANIIRILYLINEVIDEDEILYKDISCNERLSKSERVKEINKKLANLYSVLNGENKQ
jgi:hypothetical protein